MQENQFDEPVSKFFQQDPCPIHKNHYHGDPETSFQTEYKFSMHTPSCTEYAVRDQEGIMDMTDEKRFNEFKAKYGRTVPRESSLLFYGSIAVAMTLGFIAGMVGL